MRTGVCVLACVVFFVATPFAFAKGDPGCLTVSDATLLQTYVRRLPELHLPRGVERSLAAKLTQAARLLSRGRFAAASHVIDALVREVLALEGKRIAPEVARAIVERIQVVRYCEYDFTPLAFPFQNPSDIERLAPFGVPDWSGTESHNGIDLILRDDVASSPILSPSEGTVSHIEASENPFSDPVGQVLVHVGLFVNNDWSIVLTFEPSAVGDPLRGRQLDAIAVRVGDPVGVGSYIGDLLAGDLGYPHVHYMLLHRDQPVCAYDHSSGEAKLVFDAILSRSADWSEVCLDGGS